MQDPVRVASYAQRRAARFAHRIWAAITSIFKSINNYFLVDVNSEASMSIRRRPEIYK